MEKLLLSWSNSIHYIMQALTTEIQEIAAIHAIFEKQSAFASQLAQTNAKQRIAKLQKLLAYLTDERNFQRLAIAMNRDFRKPAFEVWSTEIGIVKSNIVYTCSRLHHWMQDQYVESPPALLGTRAYIHYEPKGVSLIISPWNYPVNLALTALVYGIAAGNPIILKPSEMAPHTAAFMAEALGLLFPEEEVAVVQGDAETARALLELPFRHIHFTGSPGIGKLVMAAASRHLASVTLELGGKSPALIDQTANLADHAEKLVWAKLMNNGQTCVAPDYLVIHESVQDRFLSMFSAAIERLYNRRGEGIQKSPDLARIINERHFHRIIHLIEDAVEKGAAIATGGQTDPADLYIAPTVLTGVTEDMAIMQDEIFGPVLPVVTFKTPEEAVGIIRRRPKPLSMYIGSRNNARIQYFVDNTTAGTTCINEYMLSFSNQNLPFGGVNASGIGKSQGRHGFIEFSNERSIIRRHWLKKALKTIYPPFTDVKMRVLRFFYKMV